MGIQPGLDIAERSTGHSLSIAGLPLWQPAIELSSLGGDRLAMGYSCAVGVARPLFEGLGERAREMVRLALSVAFILLVVLPPVPFLACEMDFYESAGKVVREMAYSAAETPADESLTFINVPFFFSSTTARPRMAVPVTIPGRRLAQS
ncbi:MAG: hypothetical protein R3C44_18345 [Chloroflexota bacterium]